MLFGLAKDGCTLYLALRADCGLMLGPTGRATRRRGRAGPPGGEPRGLTERPGLRAPAVIFKR